MNDTVPFWKKFKVPDPMVLIFGVLVMSAIVTHILPSGTFEREEVNGQTRVVPGSYHHIDGDTNKVR